MDTLSERYVKTRKEHKCWGCRRVIPVGSRVQTVTSADGGKITTARWCKRCELVYSRYWYDIDPYGDGLPEGMLIDEYADYFTESGG